MCPLHPDDAASCLDRWGWTSDPDPSPVTPHLSAQAHLWDPRHVEPTPDRRSCAERKGVYLSALLRDFEVVCVIDRFFACSGGKKVSRIKQVDLIQENGV